MPIPGGLTILEGVRHESTLAGASIAWTPQALVDLTSCRLGPLPQIHKAKLSATCGAF